MVEREFPSMPVICALNFLVVVAIGEYGYAVKTERRNGCLIVLQKLSTKTLLCFAYQYVRR